MFSGGHSRASSSEWRLQAPRTHVDLHCLEFSQGSQMALGRAVGAAVGLHGKEPPSWGRQELLEGAEGDRPGEEEALEVVAADPPENA